MRRLVSILLSIVAFSVGCPDREVVRLPGSISGQACGEESRVGIPNVTIAIRGPTTREVPSDGAGRFIADGLQEGEYEVFALLADGTEQNVTLPNTPVLVAPQETTVVTDTRCDGPPDPPDSGSIDGQICNRHTGELVVSATVEVIGANNEVLASATTDGLGNFVIADVPEGEHVVSIRAPNFSRSFPVTVVVGETVTLDLAEGGCEVPFGAGCTILGSMCDPRGGDGDKLAGANVSIRSRADNSVITDLTDTNGEFYVTALSPGSYDVTVSHPDAGVNEVFSDVACLAGEEAVLLGPDACANRTPVGRVEGQVCILDPNESRGRFVGTVFLKRGAAVVSQVETDADGAFSFPPVPTGTYELQLGEPALRLIAPVIVNAFQTTFIEEASCPEPADVCEEFTHDPDVRSDGRILFVVDRSGSMNLPLGAQTKWDSLKSVLSTVMGGLASTVSYGLFVYPDPSGDVQQVNCSAGVQRQQVGGTAAQINSALAAVNPTGGTPTAATMASVRPIVEQLRGDGRPLAVVLATDGAPNCNLSQGRDGVSTCTTQENGVVTCACACTSNAGDPPQSDANCALFNCLDDSASTGAISQVAALGVQTHVIGIPDSGLPAGLRALFSNSLNAMAVAGGAPLPGATRYHEATNLAALQSSLEAVTRRILACQITTPTVLDGGTSLEVRLGTQPIPQDLTRRNGWDQTGPSSIQLFGSACDAATASQQTVRITRCARP
jgi:hypothetical protein